MVRWIVLLLFAVGNSVDCIAFPSYMKKKVILVYTAEDLWKVAERVNQGELTADVIVKLENDILLNDTLSWRNWRPEVKGLKRWTAIGSQQHPFRGTFDGKGHKIYGLFLNVGINNLYQGLFGVVDEGTIVDVHLRASYIRGYNFVGGIAGFIKNSLLDGCSNNGRVEGMRSHVGGIVGFSEGTNRIINCHNWGRIIGKRSVGGIIGNYQGGSIYNCSNAGAVVGKYEKVGGIIGEYYEMYISKQKSDTLANCFNVGEIRGRDVIGGIAGNMQLINIEATSRNMHIGNCYNAGVLKSHYPIVTDGLVGCYVYYVRGKLMLRPLGTDTLQAANLKEFYVGTVRRIQKKGFPCYWSDKVCSVTELEIPRFGGARINGYSWPTLMRYETRPSIFKCLSDDYMKTKMFVRVLNKWVDKREGNYRHWRMDKENKNAGYPSLEMEITD